MPFSPPEPPEWGLPAAVIAQMEGRGTGVYGLTTQGMGGRPFNYGWPKYGPVSSDTVFEDLSGCALGHLRREDLQWDRRER